MTESPKTQLSMSVQDRSGENIASEAPIVFWLAGLADTIPDWGSPGRDDAMDKFWRSEPLLSGAVSSMTFKLAALDFKLKGPPRRVHKCETMLRNTDFGMGWAGFITKIVTDILTRDNGGFIEILRHRRNDPSAPVAGIAHLDSKRCARTGDPEYPVIYEDTDGKYHRLRWFQVVHLADMPSAREKNAGLGFCAVSRVLSAAQYLRAINVYKREKIMGKRIPGIIFAQGLRRGAIEEGLREALEQQTQEGMTLYTKPVVLASPDPGVPVDAKLIELAGLPDGYDEDTVMKWYITTLALAFGTDYTEFAPLPGGNLGSSTQTTVMSARSRGKGVGILTQLLEHAMNNYVLPNTVTFEFASSDPIDEADRINLRFLRARERNLRVQSGEISALQALELAIMDGDAPKSFLDPVDLRVQAGIPGAISQEPATIEEFVKQADDLLSSFNKVEAKLKQMGH